MLVDDIQDAIADIANDPDLGGGALVIKRDESTVDKDAAKPWHGQHPAPVEYETVGIITAYEQHRINGKTILSDDMKCILSLKDVPIIPCKTDLIFQSSKPVPADARAWSIVHVSLTKVGTGSAMATLQLRQ